MNSTTTNSAASSAQNSADPSAGAIHYRSHTDPQSSHQQILSAVKNLAINQGFSPVLDVGAAQGMLGKAVAGNTVAVDAVEMNPTWAAMARPHYRNMFVSAIEAAPLEENAYRLIVCGDVLEHTVDPVAVLKQLRRATASDAKFIISLPNVAHIAIRLMLLAGKFPQMERGILDRTHLHFYTRDTIAQTLDQAGLKIERATVTGVPIDELLKRQTGFVYKVLVRMQHVLLRIWPRMFGYQWIVIASAKSD